MLSPLISTTYHAPSTLASSRKPPAGTRPSSEALESFTSTRSSEIGLIPKPAKLPSASPSLAVRDTSLIALQGQALAEKAASVAVPGLGALEAAKAGVEKAEILSLFDRWNQALQTGRSEDVVSLYAPDAILLPTLSNKVRHNHPEIKDYFDHFLEAGPRGSIDEANVRVFGDVAVNSGTYTFDFANGNSVQARYTYVYQKLDGDWKIIEHHSSAMPEKTPHEEEVKRSLLQS